MNESLKKQNLVVQFSFQLAVDVVAFCARLEEYRKWAIANQIVRAGLSIGANIKEVQNAESKNDFIHKMKIAAKEAEELEFYFEVCRAAKELPDPGTLLEQTQSVSRILNKIIATSKTKVQNNNNQSNNKALANQLILKSAN